ncbi:Fe2+-dependent dioxygenase [Polymorphobacter sp.]|uniref:Fe2+-dependent dioxygenase n=1 Tax=Polymorphobacter sp. TaxID=1909290 RepID=UPI003F717E1A
MAVILSQILAPEVLAQLQADLAGAAWQDGSATAGPQARGVKANQQLDLADTVAKSAAATIGAALARHSGFMAAALPRRHTVPMFSRYGPGDSYGLHIDNALRLNGQERLRTDLAATLFLGDPQSYSGGELIIETGLGTPAIKLPAGQMVLYPATTRHRVAPVTRGHRLAAVFWVQSMVRDDGQRALLLDLDRATQALGHTVGANDPNIVSLTGTYHNLLRRWLDT